MAIASKRVRRAKPVASKSAGSPEPMGIASMNPPCGHSSCGPTCAVRYVGPTSPMHNHHILHAARGASHVWSAAIVSGLAVVLTGAIAFTAVQAQTAKDDPMVLIMRALYRIEMRLDRMEPRLNRVSEWNMGEGGMGMGYATDTKPMMPKPIMRDASSTIPEMKKIKPPIQPKEYPAPQQGTTEGQMPQ